MGWKSDSDDNHAGPRNVTRHFRASLSYQYALLSILYFHDNNTFHRGRTFLSGLEIVEAPIAHTFKGRLHPPHDDVTTWVPHCMLKWGTGGYWLRAD